jgi:hypothetical protein
MRKNSDRQLAVTFSSHPRGNIASDLHKLPHGAYDLHVIPPGQDKHYREWTWRGHGTANHTTVQQEDCGVNPIVPNLVVLSFKDVTVAG